jgi:hypothetical protein
MDEICGLKFNLSYEDMPQEYCTFYGVNSNRKWLVPGGFSKNKFLDHFSTSLLCKKCYNFTHNSILTK